MHKTLRCRFSRCGIGAKNIEITSARKDSAGNIKTSSYIDHACQRKLLKSRIPLTRKNGSHWIAKCEPSNDAAAGPERTCEATRLVHFPLYASRLQTDLLTIPLTYMKGVFLTSSAIAKKKIDTMCSCND